MGPPQYENENGTLTMLPSDMMLLNHPDFRHHVEVYAKDNQKFLDDFTKAFAKVLK